MTEPSDPDGDQQDRHAIRAVVEAYAARVDARDATGVAALFSGDGSLVVPDASEPGGVHEIVGRQAIAERLSRLDRHPATVHDIANHTAQVDGDLAMAVTMAFAHHLEADVEGGWTDRVLAIRYRDILRRHDGRWELARRDLQILWTEHRPAER